MTPFPLGPPIEALPVANYVHGRHTHPPTLLNKLNKVLTNHNSRLRTNHPTLTRPPSDLVGIFAPTATPRTHALTHTNTLNIHTPSIAAVRVMATGPPSIVDQLRFGFFFLAASRLFPQCCLFDIFLLSTFSSSFFLSSHTPIASKFIL